MVLLMRLKSSRFALLRELNGTLYTLPSYTGTGVLPEEWQAAHNAA